MSFTSFLTFLIMSVSSTFSLNQDVHTPSDTLLKVSNIDLHLPRPPPPYLKI